MILVGELAIKHSNSLKRSDVTGNPFEWLLGEKNVYKTLPHTSLC